MGGGFFFEQEFMTRAERDEVRDNVKDTNGLLPDLPFSDDSKQWRTVGSEAVDLMKHGILRRFFGSASKTKLCTCLYSVLFHSLIFSNSKKLVSLGHGEMDQDFRLIKNSLDARGVFCVPLSSISASPEDYSIQWRSMHSR